jgi:hypothetical protein
MQRRLEIPDEEALRRAFRGVGGMAPANAPHVARDAFGVLLKQLEYDSAQILQHALAREGVETELVDEAQLGELPAAKRVRRVDIQEMGLAICDPYDRELLIPWESLRVVSGGLVLTPEQRRPAGNGGSASGSSDGGLGGGFGDDASDTWWEPDLADLGEMILGPGILPNSMLSGMKPDKGTAQVARKRQVWAWTADVILAGGSMRFVFSPDRLLAWPGTVPVTRNPETRFLELLRAVAERAGQAALNRVAFALRDGETETISYPSRNAYQEELLWILWRLRQAGRLS